jgi:hypothetical protein
MPKRMKSSRARGSALPKHAPKRSGKRGIGPKLDAVEDFENPVKGEALRPPGEEKPKKPRQARLPEMEDEKLDELEGLAEEYAQIRDERMALTPQEKKLKDDLLAAMKKNGKQRYFRDGIEIKIVHEQESVKVRVKRTEEEASAATT